MIKLKFRGQLELSEKDVLRFYPDLQSFLKEIKSKGWGYTFTDIVGEAEVELDVEKLDFKLNYYPPRIDEFKEEGRYTLEADIGKKPPAVLRVLSVTGFRMEISSKHSWRAVGIDPQKKVITYIEDVLHSFVISKRERPRKLSEAREIYEIVKFLITEKGYRLKDEYVIEKYKQLVDLFEKPYKFTLSVELTVKNEEKVPGWDELIDQLSKFFYERGLLMKLKRKRREFLFGKKPIP